MRVISFETWHRIKWDTRAGRLARRLVTWAGVTMIHRGRKLLRWSMGRCSWCGANPGMSSSASRKGLRCDSAYRDCSGMPDV